MRCCRDVQICRCSGSLRKTNNTQHYIDYIKQYAETRQEVEEEEEEDEDEDYMSCFHKDHFRLKKGKEKQNNFCSLFLDVAL